MKIKFLGTSAGWPLPRLGCKCNICVSKKPKDRRTRSQLLVNDSILLDAGPDTYQHLTSNNPSSIRHILISHTHPDHVMGLWDLSHVYNRPQKINLTVPLEILNGLHKIPDLLLIQLKINVVKTHQRFQLDDNTTVEYFPIEHGRKPAFGIKVKSGPVLVYIPDLARLPKSEIKLVKDVHVLALDGSSLGKHGQTQSHQSIEEGIKLGRELKAKNIYFIHIGHATSTHENLEAFVQDKGGKNFHIAYDGLETNI